MDVATIEFDPDAVAIQLKEYRRRKHKDAESEYSAAEKLLAAAVDNGKPIVNVADAIAFGEFDDKGRPLLAIARADRKQVRVDRRGYSPFITFDATAHGGRQTETLVRTIERSVLRKNSKWCNGYATVPMVPPRVRPKTGQLKDWFILWEVDIWHDQPIVDPPHDPWLLKHIDGDFYSVLAGWDLSPIERAAMDLAFGAGNQ